MQKARMGISVGMLAAAIYFMGMINVIPLVLLAGYVLLFEPNEWLRRNAVKAVVTYVVFALLLAAVGLLGDVFGIIDVIGGWVVSTANISVPLRLDFLLYKAISIAETIFFFMQGVSALSQGSVKMGKIDTLVDQNIPRGV